MSAEEIPTDLTSPTGAWSGPVALAKVESAEGASLRILGPGFGRAAARLGLPGYAPRAGDTVLVTLADDGWRYVIGVVRALRDTAKGAAEPSATEVRSSRGAHARLEVDGDGREVIALRDAAGRLLVTHHTELGCTEIHADGDLSLRAGGDLSIGAEGVVEIDAGADLRLRGRGDVQVGSTDLEGALRSSLTLREGRTQLTTDHLGASVDHADVAVRELNVVSRTLRTMASRVQTEVELLETRAGRIVEHAKETFRETEGLSQTKAGRLRLVAEKSFTTLAEKVLLKARADMKIKGDKIYLA